MILIYVIIHCHPCSSDYGTCHAILFLNRPLADALTMNDHLAVTPGLFPMWGRGGGGGCLFFAIPGGGWEGGSFRGIWLYEL